jgi:hypothetical protein
VDDDSDHVLMRMTIPGHLVKRKSKTKTTVSWRLDLLKDKQIADTYRAQIKDLSHVVIDAMDEYQNIDQHQVDKVFEQVADVIRKAASVSIGCKISKGRGTAAWWTQEYAVIRSETQEAYEVAMHSKLASDWELCDAQAEEQRDETTQGLCSHGMPTRPSLWRKEHGSRQPGGQQSSCATRDPDPCLQIVRLYAKASEPRMERKYRVGGNYNGFP